ncbi:dipeptidase PepV [Ilyobacter polytropus]|uniref:Dipeptidase n=1 Tax=Ilyobacter polytropus (strain ATCC 51220 / DSM 2926 / LMG 16218 / CuHBu1) TaxID=572544 RepID=E3H765_ILYPC|nr:dipeptidase PepV [Ilyobacter polytropus]ADO82546.1 dipeptidase [Ilyobacter polytropus DSM 2926]
MNLQEKAISYKEDVIKSIQEAVRIKSVEEAPLPGKPFGKGPAEALKYFLQLGESMGFEVKNFDNYAGHIDFGSGEETIGILGHVDVVPEGEGWSHPPYAGEIGDGKIFGRGVLDDKGPMITCLYAMKAIKDSGLKTDKKIRMILGANEESGWGCMDHYFGKLNMPHPELSFTPDSTFPVTFAEKGIMQVVLKKNYEDSENIKIKGGNAFNSVSEKAFLEISEDSGKIILDYIDSFNKDKDYKLEVEKKSGNIIFTSNGKSAHASRPDKGYNAISALMKCISESGYKGGPLEEIAKFFSEKIKMETNGASMDVNFEDKDSGELTLNIGMISLEKNSLEISFDIRYPVTIEKDSVLDGLEKNASEFGMEMEVVGGKDPLYIPRDHFLVKTLMDVYKDVTGDLEAEPIAIGGGTYARAIKNCVAFGSLLHDQEDNMHQKDEYLEISKIDTWLKIYTEAIYKLAK